MNSRRHSGRLLSVGSLALALLLCGLFPVASTGKSGKSDERKRGNTTAEETTSRKPRPPDLDSRIPWMEDIGIAQVGGAERLARVEEFAHPAPATSGFRSLAVFRDDIAIAYADRLVLCTRAGEIIWTRTIESDCEWVWEVVADEDRICVLPGTVCGLTGDPPPVRTFSADGDVTGEWLWAPWPRHEGVMAARLVEGVLIVDVGRRGRREVLRIAPGAEVDQDSLATERDFDVSFGSRGHRWGKTGDEMWKEGRHQVGFMAARNRGRFGKAYGKQQARTRRWMGRSLEVGGLPFFVAERRQAVNDARLEPGRVLHVQPDGGLVIQFVIVYPHLLDTSVLYDRDVSGEWDEVERRRPVVAWFDREGAMRAYMVHPPRLVGLSFLDRGVYVATDSSISRWEFAKE